MHLALPLLALAAAAAPPAPETGTDGGLDIVIVRADDAFPPPVPVSLLPADAGGRDLLWPKDLVALSELAPEPISEAYTRAKLAYDSALFPQALTVLDAEAQKAPLPLEARYLRAMALLKVGLTAEAARELIALSDLMPTLRVRCLYTAAVALEDQKAFSTAADIYAKAAAAGPDTASYRNALLGEARMLVQSGAGDRAVELFSKLVTMPPPADGWSPDIGAEALQALAQLQERRGQSKQAAKLYKDLWLKHPLSPLSNPAGLKAKALGLANATNADKVSRAELLLAANWNPQAIAWLTPLAAQLKLKPKAEGACAAHYLLGKALKKQRKHTDALKEFGAVLESCTAESEKELRAKTLYLAGQSAAVVEPGRAKALFTQLADEYPDNSFADDALFFAADVEMKNLGDPGGAKASLARLVEKYPGGDYVGEARFRLFWLARQSGAGQQATDQLVALAGSGPDGAPRPPEPILRARYWLAQTSADGAGMTDLAGEWPANYYSDLARGALPPGAPVKVDVPGPATFPPALHAGTMIGDPSFQAGVALLRLGFNAAAAEELARVDRQGITGPTGRAEPMILLSMALQRAGDLRGSHAIAKILIESQDDFVPQPGGPSLDRATLTRLLFEMAYPRAFRQQIERWALAANVPPDLLQGLMREESALDPAALSGAGAIGLCQLMLPTAQQVARRLKLGSVSARDLQQPELNIRLGAAYLGWLLKHYDGRKPLAVAAYNAGEGAVDRWLSAAKEEPLDAFVEEIPISETRHYVKRVLTSEAVYRTLPPEKPLVAVQ